MTCDELIAKLRAAGILDRTIAFRVSADAVEVRMMPKSEAAPRMDGKEADDLHEKIMFAASRGQG